MKYITYKDYNSIPVSTRKRMRSLSYRDEGEMCCVLKDIQQGRWTDYTISTCFDNNILLGWAIEYGKGHEAMCYVRKSHRKQGIGVYLCKQLPFHESTRVYTDCDRTGDLIGNARENFWNKVKSINISTK